MFSVQEKFDFIRRVDAIDKSGQLNKGKLASIIYDLVEKKTTTMSKEISSIVDVNATNELKENLNSLVEEFSNLNVRIEGLEKKLEDHDKILESLNKSKSRKPRLKKNDTGVDSPES